MKNRVQSPGFWSCGEPIGSTMGLGTVCIRPEAGADRSQAPTWDHAI